MSKYFWGGVLIGLGGEMIVSAFKHDLRKQREAKMWKDAQQEQVPPYAHPNGNSESVIRETVDGS